MAPKQIKVKDGKIYLKWSDSSEQSIDFKLLRDECPCANCKGETVLLKTYRPAQKSPDTPEKYIITNIQTVGGYAIQISWKDGHNTGIYSWEYLKKLASDGSPNNYENLV